MSDFNMSLATLWPNPIRAKWKVKPEDFQVEEISNLSEQPNDKGEHVLLHIEKVGQNTQWVARQIARFCGVRDMDIGLYGLKDRHSVSRQWFSIYLGKRTEPDWSKWSLEGTRLLTVGRTEKKLRRGEHKGNRFDILLTELTGDVVGLDSKLESIRDNGFPNYFGAQRFGIENGNLEKAEGWLKHGVKPRHKSQKGMILSAARSFLFNKILSERVRQSNWSSIIAGDEPLQNMPISSADEIEEAEGIQQLVPSGPLLGGREFLLEEAGSIESEAVEGYESWMDGLHREGVRTARRPLKVFTENMSWTLSGDKLRITFDLPVGAFASVLLEQCFELTNPWTGKGSDKTKIE